MVYCVFNHSVSISLIYYLLIKDCVMTVGSLAKTSKDGDCLIYTSLIVLINLLLLDINYIY